MQKKNKANLGYGKEISPPAGQIKIYMNEKGFTEKEATTFLQTMLLNGWRTQTGRSIKNWKQYLFQWQYILSNPLKKSKRLCTKKGKTAKLSSYKPNILISKCGIYTFLDLKNGGR